jgi:hypothetical protein
VVLPDRFESVGKQALDESGKYPVNGQDEENSGGGIREPCSVIPGRCDSIEPQMRNCASGNLEIPGSSLRDAPE